MNEKLLKLIEYIKNPNYVVMCNDGKNKYLILGDKIKEEDDELKVWFIDESSSYIDLYNIDIKHDIKIFEEFKFGSSWDNFK